MAVLSYVDHSTNQFERSKVKRLAAYGLAIAGFVIGAIIIIGVISGLLVGVHQNYIYWQSVLYNLRIYGEVNFCSQSDVL